MSSIQHKQGKSNISQSSGVSNSTNLNFDRMGIDTSGKNKQIGNLNDNDSMGQAQNFQNSSQQQSESMPISSSFMNQSTEVRGYNRQPGEMQTRNNPAQTQVSYNRATGRSGERSGNRLIERNQNQHQMMSQKSAASNSNAQGGPFI